MMLMSSPASTDLMVRLVLVSWETCKCFCIWWGGNCVHLDFLNVSWPTFLPACWRPPTHRPACSLDGHFVFSVKATDTDLPISPSSLIIKDQPQCFPAVASPDTAIFKIGVMDCGAKMKVIPHEIKIIIIIWGVTVKVTESSSSCRWIFKQFYTANTGFFEIL